MMETTKVCRIKATGFTKTGYTKTSQGSFVKEQNGSDTLPSEIFHEPTKAGQIQKNALTCITYRGKAGRELLTGLQRTNYRGVFTGDMIRWQKGRKVKTYLLTCFDGLGVTIYQAQRKKALQTILRAMQQK